MWFLLGAKLFWKQTRLVAERLPTFSSSHSSGGDPLTLKDGCEDMPGKANRARSTDVPLSEPSPPPPQAREGEPLRVYQIAFQAGMWELEAPLTLMLTPMKKTRQYALHARRSFLDIQG